MITGSESETGRSHGRPVLLRPVLPMSFHRAAMNALRENPWLLLSHGVSAALGVALGYFGLE
jgi:hypothetical protein